MLRNTHEIKTRTPASAAQRNCHPQELLSSKRSTNVIEEAAFQEPGGLNNRRTRADHEVLERVSGVWWKR